MQVPRLLFGVTSREGTGTLTIRIERTGTPPSEKVVVELERGYVYSIHGGQRQIRPEDHLRVVLRKGPAEGSFDPQARPLRLGRCAPFQPAVVLRNHVEAALGEGAGAEFRRKTGEKTLRLAYHPHPSCLGRDERPLVTLLAAPRRIADLDATGITPSFRIDRLLAFLDAVGSVTAEPTPYEVLGVAEGAPHEEVRRAYKRLVRELHPDAHPGAPEDELRRLMTRFTAVTTAFKRLLPAD